MQLPQSERGTPQARAEQAIRRHREQAIRWTVWSFLISICCFAVFNVFTGALEFLPANAVVASTCLVMLYGYKRLGPPLSAFVLACTVCAGATMAAFQGAGLWHGTVSYLPLAPAVAGLLGGRPALLAAGALGVGCLFLLLFGHAQGWFPINVLVPPGMTLLEYTIQVRLADPLGMYLGMAVLTWAFVVAQERAFERWAGAVTDAETARQTQARFLATISHELRTPLHGALTAMQLLEVSSLQGEDRRMLKSAQASAETLFSLINDLLDYSRLDARRLTLERLPTDVRDQLASTLAPLQVTAEEKGIELTVAIAPAVPPWIETDPTRLKQIVLNLTGNAVKFTDLGRVHLDVSYANGLLHLRVDDTGIGMSDEQAAGLFEVFAQADSSIARRFGGSGLGLAIVKGIVELLGGRIEVASGVGQGTSMQVEWPAQACEAPVAVSSATPATEAHWRVLAVDDNAINRQVLAASLRRHGHTVTTAESGAAALAAVQRETFDVVLMDLHMPDMDGYETARALHGQVGMALPIIALTASPDAEHREQAHLAGMCAMLGKPLKYDDLTEALSRHVA